MKTVALKRPFQPQSPDASGVISWVHPGDLHMTKAGEQNQLDNALEARPEHGRLGSQLGPNKNGKKW
jgi:hypothetical protein